MALRAFLSFAMTLIVLSIGSCAPTASPAEEYVRHALSLMDEYGYFVDDGWNAVAARTENATADAGSTSETYGALLLALDYAGGRHSQFVRPTNEKPSSDNLGSRPSISVEGAVGTIVVPSINTESVTIMEDYAKSGIEGIAAHADEAACGWIVDLRGNAGGSIYPMLLALAPLLNSDRPPLSFQDRHGVRQQVAIEAGSVKVDGETIVKFAGGIPVLQANVVVLQDRVTASAAEGVLVAFAGQPDTVAIGAKSAGFSTGNVSFDLSDGAQLVITNSIFVDRMGRPYGGEHRARHQHSGQGCADGGRSGVVDLALLDPDRAST